MIPKEDWKYYIPSILTSLRIVVLIPLVWLLLNEYYWSACIIAFIVVWTDWFDGWFARKYDCTTAFGALLDPIADKLFVAVIFIVLGLILSWMPLWFVVFVIARELLMMLGAALILVFWGDKGDLSPVYSGKVNAVVQFMVIGLVFAKIFEFPHAEFLFNITVVLSVLLGIISFIQYVWLAVSSIQNETQSTSS